MDLAGWVGLLGLDLDKLIGQGQRIGLLYRTHARFSRAAAAPIAQEAAEDIPLTR